MTITRDALERLPDDELVELYELVVGAGPTADPRYTTDPVGWMREVLGIPEETLRWSLLPEYAGHVWDGTPDPLAAAAEAIARNQDAAIESATGTGKTYLAAALVLWFLVSFEDALVVTVAPKENQLAAQLWKEIGRHWSQFGGAYPDAQKSHLKVRLKPGTDEQETWAAIGWVSGVDAGQESATRAQGFHAAHMLIVTEETPGIPAPVMTALINTSVGLHNVILALGNPDHQLDQLHLFAEREGTVAVRISALDHPNVVCNRDLIPGATSRKGIANLAAQWGEGTAMFDSRARGISPAESTDALIKLAWCQEAAARQLPLGAPALGVDVAQSESGDKAAIARWRGQVLTEVSAFACPNATTLGADVLAEMGRERIGPEYVGVDPVGVGAATLNALNDATNFGVQALNGGAAPFARSARAPDGTDYEWAPDANSFANLRAQMYWQLREDLRRGVVSLPNDPALFRELIAPTFTVKGGKVLVEPKEAIRKRMGGRSPDRMDAVVYGNWVRPRTLAPAPVPVPADPHRDPMPDPFEFARTRQSQFAAADAFPESW